MFHEGYQVHKKVFNYVIIILIQNTAFDTANAGKENVACVFL